MSNSSDSTIPDLLNTHYDVLDKGFIRVVDCMGDDLSIVEAARVSYCTGTTKSSSDEKLIRYLMRNLHMSPFEMCEIKLHIKLPIFVARQWVRHRTANINEQSMRYSKVDNEFYTPSEIKNQSSINLQSSGEPLDKEKSYSISKEIEWHSSRSMSLYEYLLEQGVSRETARIVIPVNAYTQWYWKTNLRNLLNFIRLRISSDAQSEIREYARVLLTILKIWVPYTASAFENYVLNSVTLSNESISLIKHAVKHGTIPDVEDTQLGKSEYLQLSSILY